MVRKRLEKLRAITALAATDDALALATLIVTKTGIPPKAAEDAMHIAVAATHGIDYLITWNCKHIANAHVIRRVGLLLAEQDLNCPVICTPQELMEDEP
jgi:predicted nucleic acid-binding protein